MLRVDSGGGSAFASDVILREIERFQETDRPVVVSMGSVAASGGYWISMSADEIWASPTTLTGSIGVGRDDPDDSAHARLARRPRRRHRHDGACRRARHHAAARREHEGPHRPFRPPHYADFVGKVAEHRERSVDEIEAAAQGRVWTGTDALARGLVDELGGLADAIESAAELAGLESGTYTLDYVEQELGFTERLLLSMTAKAVTGAERFVGLPRWPATVTQALESALEPMAFLDRLNDPRGVYAYCFCDTQ